MWTTKETKGIKERFYFLPTFFSFLSIAWREETWKKKIKSYDDVTSQVRMILTSILSLPSFLCLSLTELSSHLCIKTLLFSITSLSVRIEAWTWKKKKGNFCSRVLRVIRTINSLVLLIKTLLQNVSKYLFGVEKCEKSDRLKLWRSWEEETNICLDCYLLEEVIFAKKFSIPWEAFVC